MCEFDWIIFLECFNHKWNKQNREQESPNLSLMIKRANEVLLNL